MGIYRKPTSTDVVIPHSSNHPASHKSAAFHYMLDRAQRLPLTDEEKQKEMTVIKTIATNNGYMFQDIEKAYNRQKRENNNKNILTLNRIVQPQTKDDKVWVKFTYFDDRIRILTKIFRKSNIRVAFSVNNTIKKKCNSSSLVDKYSKSGVYSLKCLSCDQIYVGQTGRSFKIRYENISVILVRHNKDKSKYALHMLQFSHEYGTIENTLEILKVVNKGKLLDVLERFYIYKANRHKQIMNEQYVVDHNVLFKMLLRYDKIGM
jgi:hypothetical protein